MKRRPKAVVLLTLLLLVSLSTSAFAAQTNWRKPLKNGIKIMAGIIGQEAGLTLVEVADRLGLLDIGINFIGNLLGLRNPPKLTTSSVGVTITGEQAKKALLEMGADIDPNADPSTLQVVAVEGLGVYTIDELSGWLDTS